MPILDDGTAFERYGPGDAPSVVMVHGLGLCQEVWQWQAPVLSERCQVITFDLFGHGQSGLPPVEPSLSLFSGQVESVMEACGVSSAAIVGFSLGGTIARRFAQDHPEKTQALCILHSPHKRTPEAQAAISARVEQARSEGSAATVEAALVRWFSEGFREANPDTMDLVRRWVLANDIDVYHRNYRVLAEGVDEVVAPDPPISVPALVMTGDEDFGNGPEMTRAIAAEIEGAEVLILKGLRHMALAENPAQTTDALMAFLGKHM